MKQLLSMLFCLQLILFSGASLAIAKPIKSEIVNQADKEQVQQAYYTWTKAVENAKGDPTKVIALYAPNAILLATLSPEIKLNLHETVEQELFDFTSADIKDYFVAFTRLKNIHATTEKIYTQLFDDIAINTGLYTFEYIDDKNIKIDVPARFTFVYQKIDGQWMIINHHSSYLPEAGH